MKIKDNYKGTLCCFMHGNKVTPLMKMAYFKPKRNIFISLSIKKNRQKSSIKTICLHTHFREISLSAIHHQSTMLSFQHSSATLMHQYQQGENGQPVKIQELPTFLQTNTVRSSDLDNMHFSHCWLRLPDASQHFFMKFRTNILQTDIQAYPFHLSETLSQLYRCRSKSTVKDHGICP